MISCGGKKYVIRKKPPGKLLPSAHQVEREYRVMKALEKSDVPVPEMLLLCEDDAIIGTPFFVMEYVHGRVLEDITLPNKSPRRKTRDLFGYGSGAGGIAFGKLCGLGLADFGKPGNYFSRQIGRWSKQYVAAKTDEIESMERLMAYLPENVPDDETSCIVHGDYRMGNMLFHPTEPRVVALLDWELSTLGHPLGDLDTAVCPIGPALPDP